MLRLSSLHYESHFNIFTKSWTLMSALVLIRFLLLSLPLISAAAVIPNVNASQDASDGASHPRRDYRYVIPASNLTLNIVLDFRQPLAPATILNVLDGAHNKSINMTRSDLVEEVFRWTTPQQEERHDPVASFGISGGIFANDLTWNDVA